MNKHSCRTKAEGLRHYEHRNYVLHLLHQETFDILNRTPTRRLPDGTLVEASPAPVLAVNGYCLDALDEVPCGAMRSCGDGWLGVQQAMPRGWLGVQQAMPRGWTLEEKRRCDAVSKRLIDEMLAELAKE